MATALASIGPTTSPGREKSERLGAEISELCSYLYAAEHRLLTLIREFDAHQGWEWLGFSGPELSPVGALSLSP